MSLLDRRGDEEEFASRLAEYDEALAAGVSPAETCESEMVGDPSLVERLSRAQSCLRLLEQAWSRAELMSVVEQHAENHASLSRHETYSEDKKAEESPSTSVTGQLKIGRFQILRELGRGGFGVVLLAYDPVLGREVALKVPRPETLLTTSLRERMIREAQAAAGLSHPNLVQVYEAGQVGPIFYVASAYCPGQTLARWIAERQRLPVCPRQAAGLLALLADAVQHAHARGILHRDISPSNILLEPHEGITSAGELDMGEGERFVPRLTDFGLARFIERRSTEDTSATPARTILGTPSSMAPEQLNGGPDVQGPASDVYGLGAILYELLGGRPPHQGKTDSETLVHLMRDEPVDLRPLRRNVPRDLEAICLRCLEREPCKRYASAAELADDLRRFLHGAPTQARPLGLTARGAKWACRQPAAAAILAICLTGILFAPLTTHWHRSRLKSAVRRVEQDRTTTEKQRLAAEERGTELSGRYRLAGLKLAQAAYDVTDVHQAVQLLEQHQTPEAGEASRGFFWHYLWRLCHGDPVTLRGHKEDVYFLTFSADGKTLGSAGQDGTIMLWEMPSGKQKSTFTGHRGPVNAIAFSPDGSSLASCGKDGTVRIWDIRSGKQQTLLYEAASEVRALLFSTDGSKLAVAGDARSVELWDTKTWQKQGELKGHTGIIRNMGWTVDGRYLASGGDDQTVKVWDLERPAQPLHEFKQDVAVTSVTFSHDGRTLASSGLAPTVKLWDMVDGKLRFDIDGNVADVNYVEFSRDDRWLATVARSGVLRIWDVKNGKQVRYAQGHADQAWCAAFSPLDDTLATASADGTVKLWDLANWKDEIEIVAPAARVESLVFTPDGHTLGCGDSSGAMHWYDLPSGELRDSTRLHADKIVALDCSSDGLYLASASLDGTVRVWEPADGKVRWVFSGHSGGALSLSISADGQTLATGDAEGVVRLWNLATGERLRILHKYPEAIRSLDFTAEGARLAVAHGRMIGVWDIANDDSHRELCGPESRIEFLSWSKRRGALAAVDASGRVYDWDPQFGVLKVLLSSRSVKDLPLGFGNSVRVLITGNSDGVVKFWGFATEQVVFSLGGHDRPVTNVVFSPDGRTLATAGIDAQGRNQLLVWSSGVAEP